MIRFGYVSIIGRPNAGKSSLTNALVGEKVSIISSKPQTTRNNILGIKNDADSQIVFVDTPGIHPTRNGLDKFMMKGVRSALCDVSAIIYIIDATKKLTQGEIDYLIELSKREIPIVLAVNKIDIAKYEVVYPELDKLSKLGIFKEIVPISAKTKKNLDILNKAISLLLPIYDSKDCFAFPDDEYTDKSVRFLISEIVREKALGLLDEEIPHGIAVVVSKFNDKEKLAEICVDIYCEKENHKNIIIGKNGSMSKKIGSLAREDIEKLLAKKVMLTIWVRVKKNWRDNLNYLSEIGYNNDTDL